MYFIIMTVIDYDYDYNVYLFMHCNKMNTVQRSMHLRCGTMTTWHVQTTLTISSNLWSFKNNAKILLFCGNVMAMEVALIKNHTKHAIFNNTNANGSDNMNNITFYKYYILFCLIINNIYKTYTESNSKWTGNIVYFVTHKLW